MFEQGPFSFGGFKARSFMLIFFLLLMNYKWVSVHEGIWTDGTWVFSTGLDQRVRFWLLEEHSILSQHAHLVVSVPEPEALSARACGR